jgi:N utilization substance protein B
MSRALAREDAFKLIFEMEITKITAEDAINYLFTTVTKTNEMWAQDFISASSRRYIENVVKGVEDNRSDLLSKIEPTLKDWSLSRISKVNIAILQLAAYEIFYIDDIPKKVSASEATELAKKYAGKESASFINGVLGTLIKNSEESVPEESNKNE